MNYYKYKRRITLKDRISNISVVGWLIIINVVFFVIELVSFTINPESIEYLALKPSNILQGKFLWTIVTHFFIHAFPSPGHLLVNMFVLYSLGNLCEKIIGRKRFIWFYLLSGIFAGLISVILSGYFGSSQIGERIFGSPDVFMVGASGAIFAIAGLYVILLPRLKFMIIFLPFFSLPAFIMVPLVLLIMWLASFIGNWPIGNVAHFGGFLVGMAYGIYLRTKYRKRVAKLQRMFR